MALAYHVGDVTSDTIRKIDLRPRNATVSPTFDKSCFIFIVSHTLLRNHPCVLGSQKSPQRPADFLRTSKLEQLFYDWLRTFFTVDDFSCLRNHRALPFPSNSEFLHRKLNGFLVPAVVANVPNPAYHRRCQ